MWEDHQGPPKKEEDMWEEQQGPPETPEKEEDMHRRV